MKKFTGFLNNIIKKTGKGYIITVIVTFFSFMAIYGYLMFGHIMTTPAFTYSVFQESGSRHSTAIREDHRTASAVPEGGKYLDTA